MSLQTSGAIKLSQIASEFGGSGPHKLSEYYRGGDNVKDAGLNTSAGIPQSGTIKIKNFYNSGNPLLTQLNGGSSYGKSGGSYNITVNLATAKRGPHTSIIILYLAHSADKGSSITFSIAGQTVVENVQQLNNVSDDGAATGMFTSDVGDVSSITITSSGGVHHKNIYVLQYDNTPNLTGTRNAVSYTESETQVLNFGKATFGAALWANAFADDYSGNSFGSITSSGGETVINKNFGVKVAGFFEAFSTNNNYNRTLTVGGSPRRTYVPRSQSGATVDI